MRGLPDINRSGSRGLTSCPEGGAAQIPLDTFLNLYNYLAEIDGEIANERMEHVTSYLNEAA